VSDALDASAAGDVRAPSDGPVAGARLGGRVVDVGPDALQVGDAFAMVRLEWAQAPRGAEPAVGDLVIATLDARCAVCALQIVGRDVRGGGEARVTSGPPASIGEAARLRQRARGERLARRAELLAAVRAFFVARGYLEVETPLAVPSPGLDIHLDAFALDTQASEPRYLITSPEYQMKRLLAGGMPRIFQLARCFRRGERGARHNPEFTMLEWYRAFSGVEAMIRETEALIVAIARAANGSNGSNGATGTSGRAVLHARTARGKRAIDVTPPFERLPIARAFARHGGMTEAEALGLALSGSAADEERFFRVLVDEVEPALAEGPPVVLCDYPASQASLARKRADDPRVAERFEVFVGGVELCNGFGELVDPHEQRARLLADQAARRAAGLAVYPIDERFLGALEEGMPPSAGNALGIDRLLAMALDVEEIGDVMTFPEGWI
jgi:lysyl-tRNA synthetase class 2